MFRWFPRGRSATTASGSRQMPVSRAQAWRALAVIKPYCAVCDVTYTVVGDPGESAGKGTRFACSPGRRTSQPPRAEPPAWEITEWKLHERAVTHLSLTSEVWTTDIAFGDAGPGGTTVTITVTHEATTGTRWARWARQPGNTRMVRRIVDSELAKLPAHIQQGGVEPADGAPGPGCRG